MNIYQRINEVRKEVSEIEKKEHATRHDQLIYSIRPALIDAGIVITQSLVDRCLITQPENARALYESVEKMIEPGVYSATYEIKFTNIDDPNDFINIKVEAIASDELQNCHHLTGSTMSYAYKYAILKTFTLETAETMASEAIILNDSIATQKQKEYLIQLLNYREESSGNLCKELDISNFDSMTLDQYNRALSFLTRTTE